MRFSTFTGDRIEFRLGSTRLEVERLDGDAVAVVVIGDGPDVLRVEPDDRGGLRLMYLQPQQSEGTPVVEMREVWRVSWQSSDPTHDAGSVDHRNEEVARTQYEYLKTLAWPQGVTIEPVEVPVAVPAGE